MFIRAGERRGYSVPLLSVTVIALAIALLIPQQAQAQYYIIDNFSTDQTVGTLSSPGIIATEVSGVGIIGTERCIEMELISTTGAALTVGVDSGTFYSGQGPMVTARVQIVWDGTSGGGTNDCSPVATSGLGGVDLTDSGGTPQDAFLLVVNSDDFPVDLDITVYDTSGGSDTVTLSLPGGVFAPVDFIIPFSDFTGVNFTTVGAIEINYQDSDPLDLIVDEFRTTSLPDLTAVKSNNTGGVVDVGETFQWTVHISNQGLEDATFSNGQTIFTDNLPSGATYGSPAVQNSTSVTGTIDCSLVGNNLTCIANGDVTIGGGGSFDVVFDVTPNQPGTLSNPDGICRVDSGNAVGEGNETNNDCSDTVDVQAPDLTATKSNDTAGTADVGETFQWTVTVRNQGAADATFAAGQTILTDNLPSGPTYGSPAVQNVTNITGTISCNIAANTLTCTADGGSVTIGAATGSFDVVFDVTVNAPGTLNNPGIGGICRVDSGYVVTETNEDNNDCQDTVTGVEPTVQAFKEASLEVDADDSGGPSPGDTLLYTITISNFDTTDARGVVYTDTPDPNTTLEVGSVTTTQGIVVQGNNAGDTSIEVNIGDIGVGSSVIVTYKVTIHDPLPPDVLEIVNQGLVSGDNFPDVPTDNPATPQQFDETKVTLQEVIGGDPPIYGDIVVFPTPELAWGGGPDRDFNRDRDTRDCILRYKNLKTGMIVNTGLTVSCRPRDIDIYENIIIFVGHDGAVRYYDINTGLVEDIGSRGSHPTIHKNIIAFSSGDMIFYYDLKTRTLTDTGVWGNSPVIYDHIIAFSDGSPSTIHYYDLRTGVVTDTTALGEEPVLHGSIIAFVTEEGQVGEDLNHDGDLGDRVIRYYDLTTRKVVNTGASGKAPAIYGRYIVFMTGERSAGRDLTGDGDTNDWVIRYYDLEVGQVYNTARLGIEPDIYEDVISFWVFEPLARLDINGDGDKSDPIVQTYKITSTEMEQPSAPLVVTSILTYPNPANSDSVHFVVQGQGITGIRVQIYDLAGIEIFRSRFVEGRELEWRMNNSGGLPVANGVYLYIVIAKGFNDIERSEIKKLVVLR